jgi:hypothetical protein
MTEQEQPEQPEQEQLGRRRAAQQERACENQSSSTVKNKTEHTAEGAAC